MEAANDEPMAAVDAAGACGERRVEGCGGPAAKATLSRLGGSGVARPTTVARMMSVRSATISGSQMSGDASSMGGWSWWGSTLPPSKLGSCSTAGGWGACFNALATAAPCSLSAESPRQRLAGSNGGCSSSSSDGGVPSASCMLSSSRGAAGVTVPSCRASAESPLSAVAVSNPALRSSAAVESIVGGVELTGGPAARLSPRAPPAPPRAALAKAPSRASAWHGAGLVQGKPPKNLHGIGRLAAPRAHARARADRRGT